MRTTGTIAASAGCAFLMLAIPAQAALHGRDLDNDPATFEAWYDDVLDITWLADANFARTSGRDADGMMDWRAATAWVENLDYFGITGWRLPAGAPLNGSAYDHAFSNNGTTDVGFGIRGTHSELAHLYYVTLGNKGLCKPDDTDPGSCVVQTGWGLKNAGPFINVGAIAGHWTGSESMCPCDSLKTWLIDMTTGRQGQLLGSNLQGAWPVRDGDLAPTGELASLTLKTSVVAGCKSVTGTVRLSGVAPAEGVVVQLADTLTSASTPATVKILAGKSSRTFTIKTVSVADAESGSVSATFGSISLNHDLTVRPMGLYSMTLSPTSVAGSNPVAGTVKLVCSAGPGPVTVELGSSNAPVAIPVTQTVVVPQGLKSATFDLVTTPVPAKISVTITAVANGSSKSKTLTVTSMAAVSPTTLRFGSNVLDTSSPVLAATLVNRGTMPFAVTGITLGGTGAKYFAQSNDCPANLEAGASCTIGVTFTPMATGNKSAKLYVATSATGTPIGVSLYGTGVLPP
jgi:hypothetical protein